MRKNLALTLGSRRAHRSAVVLRGNTVDGAGGRCYRAHARRRGHAINFVGRGRGCSVKLDDEGGTDAKSVVRWFRSWGSDKLDYGASRLRIHVIASLNVRPGLTPPASYGIRRAGRASTCPRSRALVSRSAPRSRSGGNGSKRRPPCRAHHPAAFESDRPGQALYPMYTPPQSALWSTFAPAGRGNTVTMPVFR